MAELYHGLQHEGLSDCDPSIDEECNGLPLQSIAELKDEICLLEYQFKLLEMDTRGLFDELKAEVAQLRDGKDEHVEVQELCKQFASEIVTSLMARSDERWNARVDALMEQVMENTDAKLRGWLNEVAGTDNNAAVVAKRWKDKR